MNETKYKKCPICKSPAKLDFISSGEEGNFVQCLRCGTFKISRTAYTMKKQFNSIQIANITGWLREHQNHFIYSTQWEDLSKLKTPTIGEKAIKLLKFVAKERPTPGQWVQIDFQSIYGLKTLKENTEYPKEVFEKLEKSLPYLSITWALDGSELRYIINDYLIEEQGYLTGDKKYKITPKGWAYIESLKYKNVDSQIAFIAMWFDKKMDYLLEYLESAVHKAGYEPKRVDKHEHVNRVDDEIIALIRQSKFIIADFTGQRGGVYFESGFAHGINIPVIWLCNNKEKKKLHFDTNHFNYIFWDKEKLDELEQKLTKRIESVLGKGTYNPE